MSLIIDVIRGFLMGAADVVPGVSGGTVALVLGIYERLVASVHHGASSLGALARGNWREAGHRLGQVEWRLLLPLLAGIGLAVLTLASLIDRMLEERPVETAALFSGLVAASILIAWRLVGRWDLRRLLLLAVVAIGAFLLLGLRRGEVASPATIAFFAAGAVAIVAMILPGISGSFILLMLGMYQPVLDAVNDRRLGVIVVFAAGAVIGLSSFATLLDRMLRRHHDTVMAALIGLMAGSLRVLWPWPDGTATARLAAPRDVLTPLLLAALGFGLVVAIGWVSRTREPSRPR